VRKVIVFNMITLDGYFEGPKHELDWHNVNQEFNDDFAIPQLDEIDTLIFGRKTYELMASFWPTEVAQKEDPAVATRMTDLHKLVFSHSMDKADWKNTTVLKDDGIEKLRALKNTPGKDMLIMGSSNLCVGLLDEKIIDEVRLIINPVILGDGHMLFEGIKEPLQLRLIDMKVFKSDNILVRYTTQP
jgi:dihydrofolate reductase